MKIKDEAKRIDALAAGARAICEKVDGERVLINNSYELFKNSNQVQSAADANDIFELLTKARTHLIAARELLLSAASGCKEFGDDDFETFRRAISAV